ncbi:hypothetical protein [Nocardioides nitrophenolicus]|uniref:hypothetical protein n=1 Tax=Nocardioides nitrophenolicus TaxID=60489 RepID=UPI0019599055|nr:hypothetical protein [Nocardioides nitrophenolicus]MBM7516200.1 hypothetical protein [Nocardioides nitrophenolicus]
MAFAPPPPPAPVPTADPVTRPDGVPTRVGLALLGLLLVGDLLLFVLPGWMLVRRGTPPPAAVTVGAGMVLILLYAALVALVGRTPVRRLVATLVVASTVPVQLALHFVMSRASFDEVRDVEVLTTTVGTFTALLHLTAWGVARRQGGAWPAGLLALPVVVAVQWSLREPLGRLVVETVPGDGTPSHLVAWVIFWAWFTAPVLLTGVLCFVIEQLSATRTTTARHPRG